MVRSSWNKKLFCTNVTETYLHNYGERRIVLNSCDKRGLLTKQIKEMKDTVALLFIISFIYVIFSKRPLAVSSICCLRLHTRFL